MAWLLIEQDRLLDEAEDQRSKAELAANEARVQGAKAERAADEADTQRARAEREAKDAAAQRDEVERQHKIARERLTELEQAQAATRDASAQAGLAQAQVAQLEAAVRVLADLLRRGVVERGQVPPQLADLLLQVPLAAAPASDDNRLAVLRGEGFASNFLGIDLPLPGLSAALQTVALEGGRRLDYPHFTVVLNRERKLAIFAASNLDRSRRLALSRPSVFLLDPRVPQDMQPAQAWFEGPDIDQGHLVARQEVMWSARPLDDAAAIDEVKAASDAVNSYPNVVPQLANFNRGIWAGLEKWTQDEHNPAATKINLYTGPVFADDPIVRGGRMPRRFWKIVASRASDGVLVVDAFLIEQSPSSTRPQPFQAETYRVTVAEIERITGLDFGMSLRTARRTERVSASRGDQLAASVPLLNADQTTVRTRTVQQLLDAVRDKKVSPEDQRIVASALVDAMRTEALRPWTATGRYNLVFVLAEIPAEAWTRPDWVPLASKLREHIQALQGRIRAGDTAVGEQTQRHLNRLSQNLTPATTQAGFRLYVHVAEKDDITLAGEVARGLDPQWSVAGVEYIPAWGARQRETGEVRYYRPADSAAATALARQLEAAVLARDGRRISFRPVDISRSFPNLPTGRMEVWFPQL